MNLLKKINLNIRNLRTRPIQGIALFALLLMPWPGIPSIISTSPIVDPVFSCDYSLVDTGWTAQLPAAERHLADKIARMDLIDGLGADTASGLCRPRQNAEIASTTDLFGLPNTGADFNISVNTIASYSTVPEECASQYNPQSDAGYASLTPVEKRYFLKGIQAECAALGASR